MAYIAAPLGHGGMLSLGVGQDGVGEIPFFLSSRAARVPCCFYECMFTSYLMY
jgi:hypothetical protein